MLRPKRKWKNTPHRLSTLWTKNWKRFILTTSKKLTRCFKKGKRKNPNKMKIKNNQVLLKNNLMTMMWPFWTLKILWREEDIGWKRLRKEKIQSNNKRSRKLKKSLLKMIKKRRKKKRSRSKPFSRRKSLLKFNQLKMLKIVWKISGKVSWSYKTKMTENNTCIP
jgi:hypothetical protein